MSHLSTSGFPGGASGKESACQCKRRKRLGFDPCIGKILWSEKWQATLVFLPGKFHVQRSLLGYSPWGCKESDRTEHMTLNIQGMHLISSCRCVVQSIFNTYGCYWKKLKKYHIISALWICFIY